MNSDVYCFRISDADLIFISNSRGFTSLATITTRLRRLMRRRRALMIARGETSGICRINNCRIEDVNQFGN
ncbi:MAG: hypothetical protein ABI954_08790, partial [Pyrinomonadaceae bacterium]